MTTNKLPSVRKTRTHILSQFKGLTFQDRYHSYRFQNQDLCSATSFVNKLTPPFNPDMANIVARSKGAKGLPNNPDYYTQRWAFKRDEAANRGSRVHLFAEQYPILDEPEDALEEGVCNFYDYMEDAGYEVIIMELRMTDGKLAGTCDLLLRHKVTGKYVIADWKTNAKDIEEEMYYHKPIELVPELKDNSAGKFSIQLSIYKYILESKGIEIDELWAIHLHEIHEDNFKILKLKVIDFKPLMEENAPVHNLLVSFKEELKEKKRVKEAKWKNKKWNN